MVQRMRRGQSGHGRRRGLTTPDDSAAGARHRFVVVGGGSGGLQAVRKLRHAPVDITLIDRRNLPPFSAPRLPGGDRRALARRDRLAAARHF
jgi:Pyridine nucleotide-disulphide oxidoreductase